MTDFSQAALDSGADEVYLFDGAAVLFCTYAPFKHTLSAFYIASNRCYFAAQRFCAALNEAGFCASIPEVQLKRFLFENGAAIQGKNSLAYVSGLGSRFSMQLVACEAIKKQSVLPALLDNCGDCTACANACPVGAITSECFVREKCVRQHMSGYEMPESTMRGMTTLLGCELCQAVCPKNKHIHPIDPPDDIISLFSPANIMNDESSESKHRQSKYIGKNMQTRGRLKAQSLVLLANMRDSRFHAAADAMLHGTECQVSAAKYYLSHYKTDEVFQCR